VRLGFGSTLPPYLIRPPALVRQNKSRRQMSNYLHPKNLCPRRGRIIGRCTEKARDWICRTIIRNTRTVRPLLLLPGGEEFFGARPPPALSFRRRLAAMAGQARRGRIIRRCTEKARDWICRTIIRNTRTVRPLFLLPGGEGQDEGDPRRILSHARLASRPRKCFASRAKSVFNPGAKLIE